jgi:hypothetical protein
MMRSLVLVASLALATTVARADSQAEAVALFDQGIKDMKAGNFEKACKNLERSLQLSNDSGTRGALARCNEKLGKLATSWLMWRELADTSPSADLRKDAAKQAAKIEPRVPKWVIKVAAPTAGLAVTVNDKPVDPTIEIPIPIDPGAVRVSATAPGREAWKGELKAEEGKLLTIEIPALAESKVVSDKPKKDQGDPIAKKRKTRRLIGFTFTGLGIGAAAAGGAFGFIARSRYADAKDICGGTIDQCAPDKVDDAQGKVDSARSAGTLSTILFAAGGAAIAVGVVVIVTAPKVNKEKRTVQIVPAPGGLAVLGRF